MNLKRVYSEFDEMTQTQVFNIFAQAGYNPAFLEQLHRDIKLSKEEEENFKVKASTPLMKEVLNQLGIRVLK